MRNSKAKSALFFWARTGFEPGVIVWVELAVFRVLILRLSRGAFRTARRFVGGMSGRVEVLLERFRALDRASEKT
jgi:hypothetical protein